jgi:hypothetical protein
MITNWTTASVWLLKVELNLSRTSSWFRILRTSTYINQVQTFGSTPQLKFSDCLLCLQNVILLVTTSPRCLVQSKMAGHHRTLYIGGYIAGCMPNIPHCLHGLSVWNCHFVFWVHYAPKYTCNLSIAAQRYMRPVLKSELDIILNIIYSDISDTTIVIYKPYLRHLQKNEKTQLSWYVIFTLCLEIHPSDKLILYFSRSADPSVQPTLNSADPHFSRTTNRSLFSFWWKYWSIWSRRPLDCMY